MKNTNQPAFPIPGFDHEDINYRGFSGLTKREYFAAIAMQSMSLFGNYSIKEEVVRRAIEYADELLKQLEVNTPDEVK